jgi:hypothetical protein
VKLKLPETVASSQDLGALEREVRDYAKWFAHEAIKKRANVKHVSESPTLTPGAKELVRNADQAELDAIIETLKSYGQTAPSITITLAAPAPASLKATLISWCRENIAPNILVNFRFNAALLGGMVIHSGSRVFDWSFRRQLLENREHFPEVLRRV